MKLILAVVTVGCALGAAAAGRAALEAELHGKPLPPFWVDLGAADADEPIQLTLALKQRNVDVLEAELMAVSDPTSPRYGQH